MVCAAAIVIAAAQTSKQLPENAPEQPLPFSHKKHAGDLKLQCQMCHTNPSPGELMTFPALSTCMQCHAAVKTDSPAIQTLAAAAKAGEQIRWVRVYRLPEYVFFSHKAHLDAKATCQQCHGDVPTFERIYRAVDLTMQSCMECHRQRSASTECTYCHEQQ
jgi:hypothetical protein